MKVELIIFTILFLLQGFLYLKVKHTIKRRVLFNEVHKNFIELYRRYINLCYEDKISKRSTINHFLKEKLGVLNILDKCTSFENIVSISNSQRKILNESELEKLIFDLKKSPNEVKEFFRDLLLVDRMLFKSIKVKLNDKILVSGNIYFNLLKIRFILKVLLEVLNNGNKKDEIRHAKEEVAIRAFNRKNPIGFCRA